MSGMTELSYTQDFLTHTIGLVQEYVSDIILDVQSIGEFRPDREYHWNHQLAKITNNVGQFVELTTLLSKALMLRSQKNLPQIKESHISLLFILKAINQSQVKGDSLALEELIKYELNDNLTQWKIDLIPQIKKLLNT